MKVKVERTTKKAAITKATAPEDSKITKPGDPEEEEEELDESAGEELDELKEAHQLAEQLSGQMDFLTTDLTATTKLATSAATPTTAAVRNLIVSEILYLHKGPGSGVFGVWVGQVRSDIGLKLNLGLNTVLDSKLCMDVHMYLMDLKKCI